MQRILALNLNQLISINFFFLYSEWGWRLGWRSDRVESYVSPGLRLPQFFLYKTILQGGIFMEAPLLLNNSDESVETTKQLAPRLIVRSPGKNKFVDNYRNPGLLCIFLKTLVLGT